MFKNHGRIAFSAGMVMVVASLASSCQEYTFYDDNDALFKQISYESHFRKTFGEIDPNQNWGFDPMPICGEGTRGSNTESNIWESAYHFDVPGGLEENDSKPWGWATGDVTNYERAYVYWWFSTHQWPQNNNIDLHEFFIQNVWGQPEHSTFYGDGSAYSSPTTQKWGMDNMHILLRDQTPLSPNPIDNPITNASTAETFIASAEALGNAQRFEHISDFNAGGSGSKEQVMYVFDVCTLDFTYEETFSNSAHNNWTLQQINGNYYLAFDYWHQKTNETEGGQQRSSDVYSYTAPDGYYNDWILKLHAAGSKNTSDPERARRIMCEDLGNTYDWDFNDVVFDVLPYRIGQKDYAWITIQAAGGTLPIWVGVDPTKHPEMEIHQLFGVETNQPVNVGSTVGCNDLNPITYRIELTSDMIENGMLLPDRIPVYVPKRSEAAEDPAGAAWAVMTLDAEKGKAPQKFACPTTTHWLTEEKHIEDAYDLFWTWVGDAATQDIWHHAATFESNYYPKSVVSNDVESVDYDPNPQSQQTFTPWRELWTQTVSNGGLQNQAYTQERRVQHNPGTDGDQDYITTFIDLAPYIYEDCDASGNAKGNDPKAFSAEIMKSVIDGNYVTQKMVWPSVHAVTIPAVDSEIGYATGAGQYVHNHKATIKAWANPEGNYLFTGWSDGVTSAERTFPVVEDISLTPIFKEYQVIKSFSASSFTGYSGSEFTLVEDGVVVDEVTVNELTDLKNTYQTIYVVVYGASEYSNAGVQIAYGRVEDPNYSYDLTTSAGWATYYTPYVVQLSTSDITKLVLQSYNMQGIGRVAIFCDK